MKQKTVLMAGLVAVVVGALSFYGGMQYQKSKTPADPNVAALGQFRNGARGQGRFPAGAGQNGGFVGGEVLSKDDKSITLKLQDGSSKIVLYSPSATINKAAAGTSDDIIVGGELSINGTANSDGSLTAQNIQIRSMNSASQAR